MKLKLLFPLFFILVSCATKSQEDFVQLVIPEELKGNKQAVKHLENQAKVINKASNSLNDMLVDIEELMAYISSLNFDDSAPDPKIKTEVEDRLNSIMLSQAKFQMTIFWYLSEDLEEEKKMIATLMDIEHIPYKMSTSHIKAKKELVIARKNEFEANIKKSFKLIEMKFKK